MRTLGWEEGYARDRAERLRAEAEDRRLARLVGGASWRARVARRLFEAAVAADRDETWRAVWERLAAPEHP